MQFVVVGSALVAAERSWCARYYLGNLAGLTDQILAAHTRLRRGHTAYAESVAASVAECTRMLALCRSGRIVLPAEQVAAFMPCGEGI